MNHAATHLEDMKTTEAKTVKKRRESGVKVLFRNPLAILSFLYLTGTGLMAVFAPWVAPYDPNYMDIDARFTAPGLQHWLGTDHLGRDVLSRMIHGARTTMGVSVAVVILSAFVGTSLGLISGFFRRADEIIMRVTDLLMAFPPLVGALAVMAFLGPGVENIVLALFLVMVPRVARITRGETLVLREMTFIKAAQMMKAGTGRIIFRHILPNAMSPLVVYFTLLFAGTIMAEAGLSFLGIGSPPEVPSWGIVLSEGRYYMRNAWWLTVMPGLAIFIAVLSCNLLGDGIRDVGDPRQYGRARK
ncbi:MAG: ABC transporter permease [Deltaproteobacteria bacterium]|nr:ABC transporter permease [Deltaproteobacteria bacterium]